eukprot:scpid75938/ scgid6440/ 
MRKIETVIYYLAWIVEFIRHASRRSSTSSTSTDEEVCIYSISRSETTAHSPGFVDENLLAYFSEMSSSATVATSLASIVLLLVTAGPLRLSLGRQLWTAHPQNEYGQTTGFREDEVLGTWEDVKPTSPGWWKNAWISNFRMEQCTLLFLVQRYGNLLERQRTHLRRTIPGCKRLAIALYFLAQGETYAEVAALFQVGQSTVTSIVHQVVTTLVGPLSAHTILFPTGRQLNRTMRRFEELCGLPMCCGAVDGTFQQIVKPDEYGDAYWCYKGYSAILLLARVDSKGLFTFVDIGAAGSIGDAAIYNQSQLKHNIACSKWLNAPTWNCGNAVVRPFLVGDSAFALEPTILKIWKDTGNLSQQQTAFNAAQIRTRLVVECAFGRLKKIFSIVAHSNLKDPHFASQVGLLCCALHNVIERKRFGHLPRYRNFTVPKPVAVNSSSAEVIRNGLGQYLREPL